MKRARFDIEANGLLETITKVHCLSVRVGKDVRRWVGSDIPQGLAYLDTCDTIVAHNAIGYDLMALWKLYRWTPKAEIVDTLTVSCLVHPDIFGGHSLDEWGKRLGERKTDYAAAYVAWRTAQDPDYKYHPGDEWVEYNEVMGDYCDQDTAVLAKLDDQLQKDMEGWDWAQALKMEHTFAKDFARQAWRGVMVDKPHTLALLARVEKDMAEIEAKVEPLLPDRAGTKGELKSARPPKLQFKKNGEPTKAVLEWFDAVAQLDQSTYHIPRDCEDWLHSEYGGVVNFNWAAKKYGKWHKLPTPMEDSGEERTPLIDRFPMRLKDQEELKAWLMSMGWVPTMWSYKKKPDKNGKLRIVRGDDGQPVVSQPKFHEKGELCKNLEAITSEFEHVNLVVRWVILRHRRGFITSILENLRPDGTVPATGMALGTPTSRVTHALVANVPKVDKTVVLGTECRAIFRARPRRKFVGVDAAGLELRCLAHYANNQSLTDTIIKGKKPDEEGYEGIDEIHTLLWKACAPLVPSRAIQKNVTYGWLYGAGDKKLGQAAGHPDGVAEKVGAEIRRRMVAGVPGLDGLMQKIERAAKVGYIKAIDGRRIPIRSKHATLNTLLQSCGSILVKWAQCYMNAKIREQRLDAWQVISYHDEVQLDAHPQHAEAAGRLFIEGLQWAGKRFGFRCPLDGEVKIGNNWAETH